MGVPQSSKSKRDQVFLLSLFVTLVLSFAAFTYFMLMPFSQFNTHSHGKKLYIAAELQELEKSSRVVEFSEHEDYKNLSREYDPLWDDLLTPNGGYFTANRKTNETDKLGISMFHQLHCLAMIREEMQYLQHLIAVLKDNAHAPELHSQLQRRHAHGADAMNPLNHDAGHPLHCFDYLRQSLLCNADATIEHPKLTRDGKPYIDGMGERRCKNWDVLYRASNKSDSQPINPEELR